MSLQELEDRPQIELVTLKCVFNYKFDEKGYLTGFKARLVVQGDQQLLFVSYAQFAMQKTRRLASTTLRTPLPTLCLMKESTADLRIAQQERATIGSWTKLCMDYEGPRGYGPTPSPITLSPWDSSNTRKISVPFAAGILSSSL